MKRTNAMKFLSNRLDSILLMENVRRGECIFKYDWCNAEGRPNENKMLTIRSFTHICYHFGCGVRAMERWICGCFDVTNCVRPHVPSHQFWWHQIDVNANWVYQSCNSIKLVIIKMKTHGNAGSIDWFVDLCVSIFDLNSNQENALLALLQVNSSRKLHSENESKSFAICLSIKVNWIHPKRNKLVEMSTEQSDIVFEISRRSEILFRP